MGLVVLFPGWGTPKALYDNLDFIGFEILFVDSFDLNELLVEIKRKKANETVFVGWSLGVMRALKYLKYFKIDKLILLSPTLNFLENQSRVIVERMAKNLQRRKVKTLLNFTRLNFYDSNNYQDYIKEYRAELEELEAEYLEQGLYFLLEENLLDIEKIKTITPLILTAKEDRIIKNASSKKVSDKFQDYHFYEFKKVGHNLIYEAQEEVNELIRGYLHDRKEPS